MTDQFTYYQRRAKEYDLIYEKPERQADIGVISKHLAKKLQGKVIREVACGTGFWTQIISEVATSIDASDINREVLDMAKGKQYSRSNVIFRIEDIKELRGTTGVFDCLFGGFIWSHILKQNLKEFLNSCLQQIRVGGELFFIDNRYVHGNSTIISKTDQMGNTYQIRELRSREQFEIIKNFANQFEIENLLESFNAVYEWIELNYYWILIIRKTKTQANMRS